MSRRTRDRIRSVAASGPGGAVLVFGLGVLLQGPGMVGPVGGGQESPFPHEDHQGLFPVCTGCHSGVPSGDESTAYPPASQCSGCHDGVEEDEVTWTGPTLQVSNVRFDHAEHAGELEASGDEAFSCESCHSDLTTGRMSVDESEELETCWSCHAHERDDHYAQEEAGDCSVCHVPLAESGFDRLRLEALPTPAGHEGRDFLLEEHGEEVGSDAGRCATCHTQDRCVACHVDASLPEIAALASAPGTMELPAWHAEYPEPANHGTAEFERVHAPEAATECATCHTSDDCASCHLAPLPETAASLPGRAEAEAPGVRLVAEAPRSHESLFFMEAHSHLAAAGPAECATCHTESYCVDCHDGASDGGYHPPNFVSLHPAEAFGQGQECATCHNTAAFCRACHQEVGLESRGRLGAGYHDAEPLFLLRHGQAARQNLESCASCHEQRDCVQCHGVLGAFQVSPHTADFDAEAAWARSPRTCFACHVSNPVGGAP